MLKILQKINRWWLEKQLERNIEKNVKEFDKEVDENINLWSNRDNVQILMEEQEVQQKYYNGIGLMKQRLRKDLLSLAKDENEHRRKLRETKESIFVYQGADVKNDSDKTKMVDKRINHYNELHTKKEERELLKKIREAHLENNTKLHASLMKQWETQYGKHRNSKTRH